MLQRAIKQTQVDVYCQFPDCNSARPDSCLPWLFYLLKLSSCDQSRALQSYLPISIPDSTMSTDLHSLPAGSRPDSAIRNNGPSDLLLERLKLRELAEGWPCYRYVYLHLILSSRLHLPD